MAPLLGALTGAFLAPTPPPEALARDSPCMVMASHQAQPMVITLRHCGEGFTKIFILRQWAPASSNC